MTFERSGPFVVKCDFIKKCVLPNGYFLMCASLVCIYVFLLYKVSAGVHFSDQAQISMKGNFHPGVCSFIVKKTRHPCKLKKQIPNTSFLPTSALLQ